MTFVIPMAGESRRFAQAGYDRPKFMLPLGRGFLFDHAVASFADYFASDDFLFIFRGGAEVEDFVGARVRALDIARTKLVQLDHATGGQAETVLRGLDGAGAPDEKPITVFNIDTFRPGYRKPGFLADCDGYLEVFEGEGANWSFVLPDPADWSRVAETREKHPISRLCCTGLYYFRTAEDFRWAWHHPAPAMGAAERAERYVAPLYNALIAKGRVIRLDVVGREDVIFCGTPAEYDAVQASPGTLTRLAGDA